MATQKQLDAKKSKLEAKKKKLDTRAKAAEKYAAKSYRLEAKLQHGLERQITRLRIAKQKSMARADEARRKFYLIQGQIDDIEGEISDVSNEVPEETASKKNQNHVDQAAGA